MYNNMSPKNKWVLKITRSKGIINDKHNPMLLTDLCNRGNIDHSQTWISWGLNINHFNFWVDCLLQVGKIVGHVDIAEFDVVIFVEDLIEKTSCSSVDIIY